MHSSGSNASNWSLKQGPENVPKRDWIERPLEYTWKKLVITRLESPPHLSYQKQNTREKKATEFKPNRSHRTETQEKVCAM